MIYLLTGPIRSGKTTALMQWASSLKDVSGILTPDLNGKRQFLNLANSEYFHMKAIDGEAEITIGRFAFSKKNFEKANGIIKSATDCKGWLILDEIGPLELNINGFYSSLIHIFKNRNEKMLFVVRESLVEKVCSFFKIEPEKTVTIGQLPQLF